MKLQVFTAFSGYDSQCMALDKIGIDYELVGWSEIDKYAIQAHNAVYPQWADRNYGDITKIDAHTLPDFDLFTYSSPCQDFSSAGKQAGGEKGSGTRSSLLWYCEEIIRVKKPRFLLMENVKALVSKKFQPLFLQWEKVLRDMGYTNYSQVLNAKDYGTPQNRERLFCVSILDGGWYEFPPAEVLKLRLKDVLEESVDERYYLSDKMIENFATFGRINSSQDGVVSDVKGVAPTHTAGHGNCPKIQEPLNPCMGGVCRTIKAQYAKSGKANFTRQNGLGATGVIQYNE